jgi:hypothetical protein
MPTLARSFFAVIFGFIVMIVVTIPMTLIAVKAFGLSSGHAAPGYLAFNVASSLFTAFAGGWVTGSIAGYRRQRHGLILAIVMIVMAAVSYLHYRGSQPPWYQAMLIVAPPVFAVIGAVSSGRIGRTESASGRTN